MYKDNIYTNAHTPRSPTESIYIFTIINVVYYVYIYIYSTRVLGIPLPELAHFSPHKDIQVFREIM